MLMGVDITQLDMLPSDSPDGFPEGFRHGVLEYTCDEGHTRLLGGEDGLEYQSPDQVSQDVTCGT